MGNSESKNSTEIINDITNEVIMETVLNCQQNISQTQEILLSNSSNIIISNVTMEQYASFNVSCVMEKLSSIEFENRLSSAITQFAKNETPAVTLSDSEAENVTKQTTMITNSVTDITKQDCFSNIFQSQSIVIDNVNNAVFDKINFSQIGEAAISCLMSNKSYTNAVNEVSTIIDQHSANKVSLFGDLFGDLFGPLGSLIYVIIFIIAGGSFCICCCCLLSIGGMFIDF